jgi:hypothetical protein
MAAMKRFYTIMSAFILSLLLISGSILNAQSFLIGAPSPSIGASANFSALIQYMQFDVTNTGGVVIDSVDIYPFSASIGSPFTIVVQNSSQTVIATYNGTTTVSGGTTPQRIKVNFNIPQGTGYRWGFSVNPGMTRNSTGGVYPYTVPGLMSITGNTFNVAYYYFFYNIRIAFPTVPADAGITRLSGLSDTMCSGSQPVRGMLKNLGTSVISSCQLNWAINGTPQTPNQWTGNLIGGDSILVTFGSYNLLSTSTYNVKGWSSMPNNTPDLQTANDTAYKSVLLIKPSPSAVPTATAYTICNGDSVTVGGTLSGSPPFTIAVYDGFTTQVFSNIPFNFFSQQIAPTSTTVITVTSVSDATGCVYTNTPPITVTVNPSPTATVTPSGPTTFCYGDSVVLSGFNSPSYAYVWKESGNILPGANLANYTAKVTGSYTMTATLGNCFKTSAPVQVTAKPRPIINLGGDTIICAHKNITLNAGSGNSSYTWSTGASTNSIVVDSSGVGLGTKTIYVAVTLDGCSASDTIRVSFADCTGLNEGPSSALMLHVYPNPTSGMVIMATENLQESGTIIIRDLLGAEIIQIRTASGTSEHSVDLSSLPQGVYLIELKTKSTRTTKRLMLL